MVVVASSPGGDNIFYINSWTTCLYCHFCHYPANRSSSHSKGQSENKFRSQSSEPVIKMKLTTISTILAFNLFNAVSHAAPVPQTDAYTTSDSLNMILFGAAEANYPMTVPFDCTPIATSKFYPINFHHLLPVLSTSTRFHTLWEPKADLMFSIRQCTEHFPNQVHNDSRQSHDFHLLFRWAGWDFGVCACVESAVCCEL